jgi:heptosyltransferase-2
MKVDAQRIVVRAPNWVGDVVMATPAFRALRASYPEAHLAVVLRPYVRPILLGAPWFDEAIAEDDRGIAGFRRVVGRLRRDRFDLAVILPNSFRTALEAFLGRARRRVGYARRRRSVLLTDPVAPPRDPRGRFLPTNMVDYYLTLCRYVGCQDLSPREELFVTDDCQARAEALFAKYDVRPDTQLLGINPGGAFGASKLWPAERFAAVADALAERPQARIVLFGSPSERPILEAVAAAMEHEPLLFEPGELDLDVLKPLVRRCSLLVTNDTGARHFAVAFGVPVVCIMGPTSPRYTDVNLERQIVVRVDVDCGPCQEKVCRTDHRCMTRITPEMVLAAAARLLADRPAALLP